MKPGAREPPDNRKENGEGRGRVGATCRHRSAAARRLRRAGTAPRRRPTARPPLGPALRPRPSPLAAAAAVRAERSAAQRGGCGLRRSLRAAAEQGEPPRGQHRGRAGRARASARTSLRRGGPLAAPPQPLSPPRRRAERPGPRARQLSARSRPAAASPRLAPGPPPRRGTAAAARLILVRPEPRCGSRPGRRCGTGGARGAGGAGRALRALCCRAVPAGIGPYLRIPGRAASQIRVRDGPALRRREDGCGGKHGRLRRAP